MTSYRKISGSFEIPHAAVYLLMTVNIFVYGLCARGSAGISIAAEILYRNGAMYSQALLRHEYWRLAAYGFLHTNLLHLGTNMLCLALWGGHLEKRVGACYFLILYFGAVVFGGVASHFTHHSLYLTVGASAGVSGILGALLCLWILGKINLSAIFFVTNIGLNVALSLRLSGIDWGAHLGGFAAGLIICALLDLAERANAILLRCKFPEFVKLNVFLGVCGFGLWLMGPASPWSDFSSVGPTLLVLFAGSVLLIKLIDVVLSVRKGLAILVIALAIANSTVGLLLGRELVARLASGCALPSSWEWLGRIREITCSNPELAMAIAAACAGLFTLLLYSQELDRGLRDVGFIAASLRANRGRRQGI